jgi:hypothetical protein
MWLEGLLKLEFKHKSKGPTHMCVGVEAGIIRRHGQQQQ